MGPIKIRQHVELKDIDWNMQYYLIQELEAIIAKDDRYADLRLDMKEYPCININLHKVTKTEEIQDAVSST